MPYDANRNELDILEFWKQNDIFKKSVESRPEGKPYVFYDGPPFATGLPHYGHIVASLMKDVVPRYQTMRGYRVERVWGWDCHGLPIENIVEKELGTKTKKDIEAMGVARFNDVCRSKVLGYVEEWKKTVHRLGRWVDMEHAYSTMDKNYMESVWWVFKQLWDKGLVYEDYRSMHVCPRCETTLSQQEVSEGYKDVKDISVFVKFRVHGSEFREKVLVTLNTQNSELRTLNSELFILAWTTTPWTLPGNVALAVGEDIVYVLVSIDGEDGKYILAKERAEKVIDDKRYAIEKELKGKDIVGLAYEPLFPYYKGTPNAFRVVAGDFVSTHDGTGIVHIAPAFGEDDFRVGKREGIPLVQHVSMDGRMKGEVADFAGMEVKPRSEDDKVRLETDIAIVRYLQEHGNFFKKENLTHSYPHCWRCDTPLLNYATSSWFVKVTAVKEKAIKLAEKINWSPEHIKEGRFGMWLAGARDWSISRQRFWASVMPVWRCSGSPNSELRTVNCEHIVVFGEVAELEKASGKKIDDLHKHIVDDVTFPCEKCGGTMQRVPDVLDTWFDSGSMPYAQVHYPFENKKKFEKCFPAEFIAEGQDQTRAWFYYLHVLGTAIFKKPAFKNVIVNGIVLAEDGKKMSKKLQNYPDPNAVLETYGADALRYYLVSSPVMHAESLNFSETGVREAFNKVVNTLWNVLEFYKGYTSESSEFRVHSSESANVLDTWILAKLQLLIQEVSGHMEKYELAEAATPIEDFVQELSTWYVRRSRDRFKVPGEDRVHAVATLREVLLMLSKIMAPFTPFMAEKIYLEITKLRNYEIGDVKESVHLEDWPRADAKKIDDAVMRDMEAVRKVVEMGHALRKDAGIPVRQALSEFIVHGSQFGDDLNRIIGDELNVKKVGYETRTGEYWRIKESSGLKIALNIEITPELKKEGLVREVIRAINSMRKEKGLTARQEISVSYRTDDALLQSVFADCAQEIKKGVLARDLREGSGDEVVVDGRTVHISITRS